MIYTYFAQEISKKQFKHILGFQSTLVLAKCTGIKISHLHSQGKYLQIIYCRECHRIAASAEKLYMESESQYMIPYFSPLMIKNMQASHSHVWQK